MDDDRVSLLECRNHQLFEIHIPDQSIVYRCSYFNFSHQLINVLFSVSPSSLFLLNCSKIKFRILETKKPIIGQDTQIQPHIQYLNQSYLPPHLFMFTLSSLFPLLSLSFSNKDHRFRCLLDQISNFFFFFFFFPLPTLSTIPGDLMREKMGWQSKPGFMFCFF